MKLRENAAETLDCWFVRVLVPLRLDAFTTVTTSFSDRGTIVVANGSSSGRELDLVPCQVRK